MLKGHVFTDQVFGNHIYALSNDTFLNGLCGIFEYKENMKITKSTDKIVVGSGCICIRGRLLEEDTYTEIPVDTDTAFCKLVIEINLDKENTDISFKQAQYRIIKSITTYPNLTQNNIVATNSGVYQYELARFKTSSSGISDFKDMRTFLTYKYIFAQIMSEYHSIIDDLKKELASVKDGSIFVLKETGKGLSTNDFTNVLLQKLNGIASGANNYKHPNNSGFKHIPAGGAAGQVLKWAANGEAYWGNDNNTTYGLATTSKNGLMSAGDKAKLNNLPSTVATTTANGLMSSGDKAKLNNCLQQQILYNNANGTTGVVTLSQSKSNFKYIEVFAVIGETEIYEKVDVKGTNRTRLRDNYSETGSQYSFRDELITITNTNITRNKMVSFTMTVSGETALKSSTTEFKITKVVGYK